jgi:probable rRNA maturation factor
LGCDSHEISILITDNDGISELNKTYRNVDKPTNVLSFPMQERQFTDITPGLLGDVVISCETAQNEACKAKITLDERMSQLLIHGILHLLGFDHEVGKLDAKKMEEKSLEILRLIENNKDLNGF